MQREPIKERIRRRLKVELQRLSGATNGQFIRGSRRRSTYSHIQRARALRFDLKRDDLIADAQDCRWAVSVNRIDDRLAVNFCRFPPPLAVSAALRPDGV